MKKWLGMIATITALTMTVAACGGNNGGNNAASTTGSSETTAAATTPAESAPAATTPAEPVSLRFMYWGSNDEKKAIEGMVKAFNDSHPNIQVKAEYVTGDFQTKINTLMASNQLPDLSYLGENTAIEWAKAGKLLDMTEFKDQFPALDQMVPNTTVAPQEGQIFGTNSAVESTVLYYNKDLFAEAGLSAPPVTADTAWNWDEFLQTAIKLTKDKNGKHPNEDGFDANNITQYGVSFPTWWMMWLPLLASNGAGITDETGTKYAMNSPEAVEVFQNMQDLMYKYHVAPTAVQSKNLAGVTVNLQTKKVAMAIEGQWLLLDFANQKIDVGLSVLPKFKEPKNIVFGGATVVYKSTKHPKEAMEFFMYHNDPSQVDLFAKGLWMPTNRAYYTEQDKVDSWTKNDAHPENYATAVIDYALNHSVKEPAYDLIGYAAIEGKINPALDQIWTNKKSAKEALDALEKDVQPLLKGKYK